MLIQIIEDDRALSEGIALALKEPSLDFVQSMTVQAAKEAFEKCMPELLILDVNLPSRCMNTCGGFGNGRRSPC